jgi:hypothetical protein
MPMKLIETTVSETTVHMQLADNAELDKAAEWLEFEVPVSKLKMADGHTPMGDPTAKRLVTIQLASLHVARDAIDEEIQRLSSLLSAIR